MRVNALVDHLTATPVSVCLNRFWSFRSGLWWTERLQFDVILAENRAPKREERLKATLGFATVSSSQRV